MSIKKKNVPSLNLLHQVAINNVKCCLSNLSNILIEEIQNLVHRYKIVAYGKHSRRTNYSKVIS